MYQSIGILTILMNNRSIAQLLRSVAASLTLSNQNPFQIRAYENAADSIEHSTSEIKDLWEEGKLDEVPGVGEKLKEHLTELFKTGKVKHFDSIIKKYPEIVYQLLDIPGVGPKTALLVSKLGVKGLEQLKKELESGQLEKKGLSSKLVENLKSGLLEISSRNQRLLLAPAQIVAEKVLSYLKKDSGVKEADALGSLRRQSSTVGDLDFSASSDNPAAVVDYFTKMPGVTRVLDKGENKASIVLNSGLQLDLLVGRPESYGALLQHFTGGKNHNIHLRTLAEKKGYSLSEYGVKNIKTGKTVSCKGEDELYKMLSMQTPSPEIREDAGEIETALAHKLPDLVELEDIKGDLHIHSNYPLDHPSHGPGVNSIEEMIKKGVDLGYEYLGISDHPPAFDQHSSSEIIKIIEKRTKVIQKVKKTKNIHVLNGLEIDILTSGSLSVPDEALKTLDYCIAGIHSGHRRFSKEEMTKRLLKALENPYVDIISHPSGRLINERSSFEANWEEIFKYCAKNKKLLEINGSPNRMDLREDLVRVAGELGVKFVVNSDAHSENQMDNLKFGVSVARRGWVTKEMILNSWDWKKFSNWFNIKQ